MPSRPSNRQVSAIDSSLIRQIQSACDDLYCDPDDAHASSRVHRLIAATDTEATGRGVVGALVSRRGWRRLVKIACDELHADPTDRDAQDRLILLLAAGGQLSHAVA